MILPKIARLHLSFEPDTRGETVLRIKQQEPPWRVVRGFRADSGELLAHVHNVSGGILDSDRLVWQVDVAAGAQAQVTSTGATRIYRSRSEDRVAAQHATVRIAPGGSLEYLPDQLIPYAGSRFEQTARLEVGLAASLLWWDMVAPGREASGEVFRYESLASSFELIAAGEPVALEQWTLQPAVRRIDSPARLGRFQYFASCFVCRPGEAAAYWQNFAAELQSVTGQLSGADVLWGVAPLRAHGLVVRGVAVNGRPLAAGLIAIWKAAKWFFRGRVATLPRKIH